MAWVEITDRRSQKAKHFYDSTTGQYRAEFRIDDIHYKDNNSVWQNIDESLINDGANGFDKKCDKCLF